MTKATDLIAAERERQITEEGYTAEHDRNHASELTRAAQSYVGLAIRELRGVAEPMAVPILWPWAAGYWKPTGDPVRDLVKAGALIAAAIDSLLTTDAERDAKDRSAQALADHERAIAEEPLAPDLSADEKAEVARFGIHQESPGLPVVRVERAP